MKKKRYLPLYYKWCKHEKIPVKIDVNGHIGGLCSIFYNDELFELLKPMRHELVLRPIWGYWGCDEQNINDNFATTFTPLRQNIILFLAAMNNEL